MIKAGVFDMFETLITLFESPLYFVETQDNNLLACRFYEKCGFVIGAVNTMLYRNFNNEEFAVFWYLSF